MGAFPDGQARELARLESYNKHLYRPNTYLHKWWARRCGTTFRCILKHFVSEPGKRDFYQPGGLEGNVVLDPMMGGTTTLHEAIRLGASVIGADIDPIPVLQARASLSQVDVDQLGLEFEGFFEQLYGAVGSYFQTECPWCGLTVDSRYTLHGLRKHCRCGPVVQVDRCELRYEEDRVISLQPDDWQISHSPLTPGPRGKEERLVTKAQSTCPVCGVEYREALEDLYYERYVPLVIVGNCPNHGLFFRRPGASDTQRLARARRWRSQNSLADNGEFAVKNGPKSGDLLLHGVRCFLDLYTSRQLMYVSEAIRLLRDRDRMARLNLGLLVSTSLEFNCLLCGYKGADRPRAGAIRNVFALHAYSFPYTAAENNPVNRARASGNLRLLFHDRIERGRVWAAAPLERRPRGDGKPLVEPIVGEVDCGTEVSDAASLRSAPRRFLLIQGDSRQLPLEDACVDLVVTDPPFFDNVQYSDLAQFFRVWLARLLPGEADWWYDHANSAVAAEGGNDATAYGDMLGAIFSECARVLRPNMGAMALTFHHWNPDAWAQLTMALGRGGFRLREAYVLPSENPMSVHIGALNAVKHDAILIFELSKAGSPKCPKRWLEPRGITTEDSERFCQDCASALGWFLQERVPHGDLAQRWRKLMRA
jgi:putative DNA methylase